MLRNYTLLPVTAGAGLVAGAGADTFLAAALAAAGALWLARRHPPADLCFTTFDPLSPDATLILEALRQTLDRARGRGRPVRLRLAALPAEARPPVRLTLSREGDAQLESASTCASLKRGGVWIPDHPLPLLLTRNSSLTLVFEPCEPGRMRVSLPPPAALGPLHLLILSLLAALACALDSGWLLAATLGFVFQSYVLAQQANRPPDDAGVQRR